MKTSETIGYMAIDQYGTTYLIGDNPPRKWLMDYFGTSHADKMYRDTENGPGRHVGYIVSGHWCEVFRVSAWKTD